MTIAILAAAIVFQQPGTTVQTPQQPTQPPAASQQGSQQPSQNPRAPAPTQNAPAPVLTLDDAVRIAQSNAFAIATAQSQVRQTRAQLNQARAQLGPRVGLNAQDTHNFTVGTVHGGTTGSGGGGFSQQANSSSAGVTLNMPIDITGQIGAGIRGGQAAVHAAEQSLAGTENTVVLDTRVAYYNVLRAAALVGVAQSTVASAQQAVTTEQQQEAAGVVAHVDVLRLQAQLAQAQSDLISAQTGLALSKENLNNTIGRPIETPFDVQEPTTLPTVAANADQLTAAALARRPEIQAIEFQRQALAWATRAEASGLLPSLNVSALYNRNLNPATGVRDAAAAATIALSWPIFDSGLTRARVQAARESEVQARIQEEQLQLGVSLEVRQAVTDLVNARATLDVAQSQVTAAAETYRLAQVRLQAGEGTSLEVSTALTALVQAQQGLANARYNYLTAYAQLQQATAADDPDAAAAGQPTPPAGTTPSTTGTQPPQGTQTSSK